MATDQLPETGTLEATPAVDPADISVAILYPGNRVRKMSVPLSASEMDVAVEPSDAYERDVVICDNADRDLGKEVLRNRFHDAKLVYRMRGDVFHELDLWGMHPIKHRIATQGVLPRVDGVVAVTDRLAEKYTRKTGVPSGSAGLSKDPDAWPDVTHTDRALRAVTLTNMDYWRKVSPIVEWAGVVDRLFSDNDLSGRWRVCGDGRHAGRLREALAGFEHVEFAGFVDAADELADSNVMFHPSLLDGQPNSILEGMATGIPVVTNDFAAFTEYDGPISVVATERDLVDELHALADPSVRRVEGERNESYVREHHSKAAVARQYERFCQQVVSE